MLGKAAVAMWWDIAPEVRAEWEAWHTVEHFPERLGIPGFLRGTRWVAPSAGAYFVLYETEDASTLTGPAYLERLNNPTPWSRRMMPHHRNMVRSLCRVHATSGAGLPGVMATVRFSPRDGRLPGLPSGRGITGAHLLQSQPMPGTQTEEQKIRGGDATADWVFLVGGYDAEAVQAAAANAAPAGATLGLYRLGFSQERS
jgi:hypothetical protein